MSEFSMVQFREHVIDRCPRFSDDDVDRVTRVTLRALSEQLARDEVGWLRAELPASLASVFDTGRPLDPSAPKSLPPPSKAALFQSVAKAERVDLGVAIEHTEIICRVLSEFLSDELVQTLRKHLPPLGDLFEIPEPFSGGLGPSPGTEVDSDLAGGRPGSKHPLFNATARALAHEHSVARSDDPHADRKLSSSHLPAAEREDRTLATGEAGARRRLSDGH